VSPLKALMLATELRADALRDAVREFAVDVAAVCRSLPTLRFSSMPRGSDCARRRSSSIANVSMLRR